MQEDRTGRAKRCAGVDPCVEGHTPAWTGSGRIARGPEGVGRLSRCRSWIAVRPAGQGP